MSFEDIIFALALAAVAFGVVYWMLYSRYRNINKKYEVVEHTESLTLQTHVSDQFNRKNKGLKDAKIAGYNQLNHTARVNRIQHL